MNDITRGLFDFIAQSPTGYHAVATAERELIATGHQKLLEGEPWTLVPGGKYYVTREQSSLIAFQMPKNLEGFMVAAAHTDSPCFRIKEQGELRLEGYTKLDVDKYGGMIFSAWLDRPLSLAGRLLVATDRGIETRLVHLDRDLLVIPSLAIHMDRSMNEGKKFSAQTDLLPLLGKGDLDFLELAAEAVGVQKADILSHDLYLFCRTAGTRLGPEGELILCPRLDDLQCVYGLLEGYLHTKAPKGTPVLCLFDSEEVGSQTRQGAMSTFLKDTLRRICLTMGMEEQEYLRVLSHSMLVSADNAHGVHPNHPEKASLTSRPKLGEGVVIKFGSGYATSGTSAALLRQILKGMPLQTYFNHGDIAGGRTLGQLALTQVPLTTVDIGLAQLAMHSACETAGTADTEYLIAAMERFFAARIRETAPGSFLVEN